MSKLFWIDLEMTGLNPKTERVIEVAAIVTDWDFNELETYHSVVKQDQKYLDSMDEWNRRTHGETGLAKQVPYGREEREVEKDLVALVGRHFQSERAIIAGNSIAQDKLFIDEYFKTLSSKLHYRMLDVTSWKIVVNQKFGIKHEKRNTHKALDDIRESIAELKYYLDHIHL